MEWHSLRSATEQKEHVRCSNEAKEHAKRALTQQHPNSLSLVLSWVAAFSTRFYERVALVSSRCTMNKWKS